MKRSGYRILSILLAFMLAVSLPGNALMGSGISSAARIYAAESDTSADSGTSPDSSRESSDTGREGAGTEAGGGSGKSEGGEASGSESGSESGETEGQEASGSESGSESGETEGQEDSVSESGSESGETEGGEASGGESGGESGKTEDGEESGSESGSESGETEGGETSESESGSESEITDGGEESDSDNKDDSTDKEDTGGSAEDSVNSESGETKADETEAAETGTEETEASEAGDQESGSGGSSSGSSVSSGGAGGGMVSAAAPAAGPVTEIQEQTVSERTVKAAMVEISLYEKDEKKTAADNTGEDKTTAEKVKKPTPTYARIRKFFHWLLERDPVTARDKEPEDYNLAEDEVTVEITGILPEGVTAKAHFTAFAEDPVYAESALMALDIRLYDEDGHVFSPEEELTVRVGGLLTDTAAEDEKAFTVYEYVARETAADKTESTAAADGKADADKTAKNSAETDADTDKTEKDNAEAEIASNKTKKVYAPEVHVYRDHTGEEVQLIDDVNEGAARASATAPEASAHKDTQEDRKKDKKPGTVIEEEKGLTADEEGTLSFTVKKMPLYLAVTATFPENTLHGVTEDGTTEVEITGEVSEDAEVVLKAADTRKLAAAAEGTDLLNVDIRLLDEEAGEYLPDRTVNLSITDDIIGEALEQNGELEVWQIPEKGAPEKVEEAEFTENTVTFEAEGTLSYAVVATNLKMAGGMMLMSILPSNTPTQIVTLSKKLEDPLAAETAQKFVFSCTLTDAGGEHVQGWTLAEGSGDTDAVVTDEYGEAEITMKIKDGETVLKELKVPTEGMLTILEGRTDGQIKGYTTRVSVDGHETEDTKAELKLSEEVRTVAFANTRKTVSLTVKKQLDGLAPGGEYQFTATLLADDIPVKDFAIHEPEKTDEQGNYTFRLTGSEGGTSKGLQIPVGAELTIAENEGDYDTQITYGLDKLHKSSYTIEDVTEDKEEIVFTNRPVPICKIVENGTEMPFATLGDAVSHVKLGSGTSAVIEMLDNYEMPASDSVSIPSGYSFTVTTASDGEYPFRGDGTEAVITRGGDMTSEPMFSNGTDSGTLILENVILDGNHISAAAAMVENGGTLVLDNGALLKNAVNSGSGGAVYSQGGSLRLEGCTFEDNQAEYGGAIAAPAGTVSMNQTAWSGNTAREAGGALWYGGTGSIDVGSGTEFTGNEAKNGGAVYAKGGSIGLAENTTVFRENSAAEYGGAISTENGQISISAGTITQNTASNGSAVYIAHSGTLLLSGGTISGNVSAAGGAIGVGSSSARLNFRENAGVTGNTLGTGDDAPESNVYLDQDTDAVINGQGLSGSSAIGIYVPGDYTEDLFIRRGQAGASFGTFTDETGIGSFKNDRIDLTALADSTTKKMIWGNGIEVEIRYLGSFQNGFPQKSGGSWNGTKKYIESNYGLKSDSYQVFSISDEFIGKCGSTTAAFGCAFADTDESSIPFESQLVSLAWNRADAAWDFVKRDGTKVRSSRLIIYYAEPTYITIENNTDREGSLAGVDLAEAVLLVLGKDIIRDSYGYVIMKNNVLCDPRPVLSEDLNLRAKESVKLMLPGGCGRSYSLGAKFTGSALETYAWVEVERTGQTVTQIDRDAMRDGFLLEGTTPTASRDTLSILFGGARAICRIVDKNGEEHPFTTLTDAVKFAETDPDGVLEKKGTAVIEMLTDYLLPEEDVMVLEKGDHITFTTAPRSGATYNYTGGSTESVPRAIISRDPGNRKPFIYVANGGNDGKTSLTADHIIFDGRNLAGSTDGGAIQTNNCDVTVICAQFKNFMAGNGGGMYVDFRRAEGSLIVRNSEFENCISQSTKNRQGGGAIWTSAQDFTLEDNRFVSCSAGDQGGAVFHRIDNTYSYKNDSRTTAARCTFQDCHAQAAGGMELDSYQVSVTDCRFTDCYATVRNGGGLNIYIHDSADSTEDTSLLVESCDFRGCSAVNTYGGGLRSCALHTTVRGCGFYDCTAKNGGGISLTNANGLTSVVEKCTIQGCTSLESGGGLHCVTTKAELVVDGTRIQGNTASKMGGGVYTTTNMTLKNDSEITENRLTTQDTASAAGVYMRDLKTLTLGDISRAEDADYRDHSTIKNNTISGGGPSNLRLSESGGKNAVNAVFAACHLDGEICVLNPKNKGTQFGSSEKAYPDGVSESRHIILADDGVLYGVIDRNDTEGKKIVWQGAWICKITDENEKLLYLDQNHAYPAIFDALDTGTTAADRITAFGILKNSKSAVKLYDEEGKVYSGGTYYVKMLVESYTASKYVTTNKSNESWEHIILTTASADDDDGYPYTGKAGTTCTIFRGPGVDSGANNSLMTAKVNMTLRDITLDGGSGNGLVTGASGGLFMMKDGANFTLTIGENAVLQNSSATKTTSAVGGAICVNSGNLRLEGGIIRNCSAQKGGAIYAQNNAKSIVMTGESLITGCTAADTGGAVFFNKGDFTLSGGTISGCSAKSGGAVYAAGGRSLIMTGGTITGNTALVNGGGIAVDTNASKLFFSGRPRVIDNTMNGLPCNTALSFDSNTIIYSGGLSHDASIGIYVPDGATLFSRHGQEGQPFGQYTGDREDNIHCFINDRNGLKGGLIEGGAEGTVYWVRMLSLEVGKWVESDYEDDFDDAFEFEVILIPTGGGKDINGTYGDMTFLDNRATFYLKHDETMTAEDLPEGYRYRVKELYKIDGEIGDEDQQGLYVTAPASKEVTGYIGENLDAINPSRRYISKVMFNNIRVVCKITDASGRLMSYKEKNQTLPAVYPRLTDAFASINSGRVSGSSMYHIEMLVPEHTLDSAVVLDPGKTVTLTTASPESPSPTDDKDFYNYRDGDSGESTATVTRDEAEVTGSMFTLYGSGSRKTRLILDNIVLDGAGDAAENGASGEGGIVSVRNSSTLEIKEKAVLQNSSVSRNGGVIAVASGGTVTMDGGLITGGSAAHLGGAIYADRGGTVNLSGGTITGNTAGENGAGIYLTEGSTMNLSGNPDFGGETEGEDGEGNYTEKDEFSGKTNGGEAYDTPRQDIYIAGYASGEAASLILQGDLDNAPGTIWVWADENTDHCKSNQQFAKLENNVTVTEETLKAFRNAVDDETSENQTESWLYGTLHDGEPENIYWNGLLGERKVILRKISGRTFESLEGAVFDIYRGASQEPASIKREDETIELSGLVSDANGIFFAGYLPFGTYYLHEVSAPAGYSGGKWFTLRVSLEGVEQTGPRDEREDPEEEP